VLLTAEELEQTMSVDAMAVYQGGLKFRRPRLRRMVRARDLRSDRTAKGRPDGYCSAPVTSIHIDIDHEKAPQVAPELIISKRHL
jgi:hypothetical protein